jgi:hypothetical protein
MKRTRHISEPIHAAKKQKLIPCDDFTTLLAVEPLTFQHLLSQKKNINKVEIVSAPNANPEYDCVLPALLFANHVIINCTHDFEAFNSIRFERTRILEIIVNNNCSLDYLQIAKCFSFCNLDVLIVRNMVHTFENMQWLKDLLQRTKSFKLVDARSAHAVNEVIHLCHSLGLVNAMIENGVKFEKLL